MVATLFLQLVDSPHMQPTKHLPPLTSCMKPGMVTAVSIKMASTAYAANQATSSLTVNWPRPQDGNPPSCITDYFVDVYGVRP